MVWQCVSRYWNGLTMCQPTDAWCFSNLMLWSVPWRRASQWTCLRCRHPRHRPHQVSWPPRQPAKWLAWLWLCQGVSGEQPTALTALLVFMPHIICFVFILHFTLLGCVFFVFGTRWHDCVDVHKNRIIFQSIKSLPVIHTDGQILSWWPGNVAHEQ